MKIQTSYNMGQGFALPIHKGHGIAFAIPTTRLVRVEYVGRETCGKATVYNATLPRPSGNAGLQCELLKRKVAMSQVLRVLPVVEWITQARD